MKKLPYTTDKLPYTTDKLPPTMIMTWALLTRCSLEIRPINTSLACDPLTIKVTVKHLTLHYPPLSYFNQHFTMKITAYSALIACAIYAVAHGAPSKRRLDDIETDLDFEQKIPPFAKKQRKFESDIIPQMNDRDEFDPRYAGAEEFDDAGALFEEGFPPSGGEFDDKDALREFDDLENGSEEGFPPSGSEFGDEDALRENAADTAYLGGEGGSRNLASAGFDFEGGAPEEFSYDSAFTGGERFGDVEALDDDLAESNNDTGFDGNFGDGDEDSEIEDDFKLAPRSKGTRDYAGRRGEVSGGFDELSESGYPGEFDGGFATEDLVPGEFDEAGELSDDESGYPGDYDGGLATKAKSRSVFAPRHRSIYA